jgi:hypothetical protein
MNAIATTICIVVAILCWTWLRTKGQALEASAESKRLDERLVSAKTQADLVRDMADRGYAQVPVICEAVSEAGPSEADEDDFDDTEVGEAFSEHRTWQLAWVPKDQIELMMATAVNPDAGNADLLEAALRPT